jgi:hypothetical protein
MSDPTAARDRLTEWVINGGPYNAADLRNDVTEVLRALAGAPTADVDAAEAIVEDEKRQHDALDDGWRPSHDYLRGYRAATERAAEIAREHAAAPTAVDEDYDQGRGIPEDVDAADEQPIAEVVDDFTEVWHDEPVAWIGEFTLYEFLGLREAEVTPFGRDGVLPERLHQYWRWLHARLGPRTAADDDGMDLEAQVAMAEAQDRPEVVTLCGSMRFFPRMLQLAAELTLDGAIVVAPFSVVAPEDQGSDSKARLDELHRRKIDMADRVIVVTDETGYYGTSTAAEIQYAHDARGLAVEVLEVRMPCADLRVRALDGDTTEEGR